MHVRDAVSSLATLLATCVAAGQEPGASRPPTVEYRVSCELGDDPRLRVEVAVRGLDRSRRDVRLELPGWGEWYELDDYYVRRLEGVPPIRHDQEHLERFLPALPDRWDGTLRVSYEIPIVTVGSRARVNRGLLPWRTPGYVHGFTSNTLMRVVVGDERQDGDRRITLVPPPQWSAFTGWMGLSSGMQTFRLPAGANNTVMVFGKPVAAAKSPDCGGIEVVQFGAHADRTAMLIDLARSMRTGYEKTTGAPPPEIGRIVVTEPGFGGTHVEGAITIGHPSLEDDGKPDVGTAHFLAHEMFHAWLPGVLGAGHPGLEWFFEGFTDYFSLWQLVSSKLVSAQQFGDRLRWFEQLAAASPACGKVRFDDRDVDWRIPDNETVAYKGGALMAFHVDATLRSAGKPGLHQLVRDLIHDHDARYSLDAIQRWVDAQGLAEFRKNHLDPGRLPDAGNALVRIGFAETFEGENRILKDDPAKTAPFFTFSPRP